MGKKTTARLRPCRAEHGPRHRLCAPLGLEVIAAVLDPYAETIDVTDLCREAGSTS